MSLTPGLKTLPECSIRFTYMSSVEHWSARLVIPTITPVSTTQQEVYRDFSGDHQQADKEKNCGQIVITLIQEKSTPRQLVSKFLF